MSWKELYQQKLTTAEEAVQHIKSGHRVVIGHAVGEPLHLVDALVNNKEAYENVEIVHMVAMGQAAYAQEGMEKHFRHNALFVGGSTRKAVASGGADYTPVFFHQVPSLFKSTLKVDVALVQLSPPDAHGWCSYGTSVDYTKAACENADLVIAQINEAMPRTMGDSFIHVRDLDHIVRFDAPLLELPRPKITDVEREIGRHCAALIEDGDTLQLGIGAIPDAVLSFLGDKKDLGIHSEMFADGVVDLIEQGVITNRRKNFMPDKLVVTFLMGTKALYDFVDNNPMVEMRSVDFVNDPRIAMQNDNLVSINSCVQVDLMGQVCAESIGLRQISGVGGQVDFVRAAAWSKNGRAIIAMPSTQKGTVSKIVPLLDEGAAITTSRNDVDILVTEYGVAHLRGKTLRQRAQALIAIAHPNFRESLTKEYTARFL